MRPPSQRAEIRQRFLQLETATVADVLDELGLGDQGLAADVTAQAGRRLAGWAYTITGETASSPDTGDEAKMRACGGIGADEVAVWAGAGEGMCFFGELIAVGMSERGCVGAVVDGGVRDRRWLEQHGFPVFARYRTPVQSIGRWRVTDWQVPVTLPGATASQVRVRPGDFVVADEDGVVVIPDARVEEVLTRTEQLSATEAQVRAALQSGLSLSDCLERFGHV